MKFFSQIFIILLFSFAGEILNRLIPLPIPGSVYGLVLLFASLCAGIVKTAQIEDVADFLTSIMPIYFVAPTAMAFADIKVLGENIIPILVIVFVSTVVVIAVTGKTADAILKKEKP